MIKLSYASTKNKDMKYAVKIDILDDFFFLEAEGEKYIFLDHREFGFFQEKNKNPNIEAVLVTGGGRNDFALALIQKYSPNSNEIAVPVYFPLDLADHLRKKGIVLKIRKPYYPWRAIKGGEEIEMIEKSLKKTHSAFLKIEEILGASEIVDNLIFFEGKALTSEFLKSEAERVLFDEEMLCTEGMIISCGPHEIIIPSVHSISSSNKTLSASLFKNSLVSAFPSKNIKLSTISDAPRISSIFKNAE